MYVLCYFFLIVGYLVFWYDIMGLYDFFVLILRDFRWLFMIFEDFFYYLKLNFYS